ncbi:MAG: hypothetical protein IPM42_13295 [Saprospiraceae bacterium]|nr:hypothetical protein [Saprospiraceae bacterium]
MKNILIVAFLAMILVSCGQKNPLAEIFIDIPFYENFNPSMLHLDKDLKVLYNQKDDVTDILLIKSLNYNSRSLFSDENTENIMDQFGYLLNLLAKASQYDIVSQLVTKKELIFLKSLPKMKVNPSTPVERLIMNIDDNYGLRIIGSFFIPGEEGNFPIVMYAIHNKFRNTIVFIQYVRIKDNKGEPFDKYENMMKAIEQTNIY